MIGCVRKYYISNETVLDDAPIQSWMLSTLTISSQIHENKALELGRGVEKDLEKAKQYYRVAYREGHPLARRKLQTLNFLE